MLKAELPFRNLQLRGAGNRGAGNRLHLDDADLMWLIGIRLVPWGSSGESMCATLFPLPWEGLPKEELRDRTDFNWVREVPWCTWKWCLAKGALLQTVSNYCFSPKCSRSWKFPLQISPFSLAFRINHTCSRLV